MEKTVFDMVLESAKAEGKRIREAIEAAGGKDRPIETHPGEREHFSLEIDLRDGVVRLTNSWGNDVPAFIYEGNGLSFQLAAHVSRLALAALLEATPELVADVVKNEGDDSLHASQTLVVALHDLIGFHVMGPAEWFDDITLTGKETDEELRALADVREDNACGYDSEVYLAFDEAEAFEWLTKRRNEALEELALA